MGACWNRGLVGVINEAIFYLQRCKVKILKSIFDFLDEILLVVAWRFRHLEGKG